MAEKENAQDDAQNDGREKTNIKCHGDQHETQIETECQTCVEITQTTTCIALESRRDRTCKDSSDQVAYEE